MAQTARNIIVGAALIYLSVKEASDGTAPEAATGLTPFVNANTTIGNATTLWKEVGYTDSGLELSYEPTFNDIVVDQSLDAAVVFKSAMKVTIKTSFAEATLENLVTVYGQRSGSRTGATDGVLNTNELTIQGGALGEYPNERSLQAVGPGPRTSSTGATGQRVYYASRVLSVDTSAQAIKRDAGTYFPVSFRLLPVASSSNAYGKITDRIYTS
jgi:hypothetical protein